MLCSSSTTRIGPAAMQPMIEPGIGGDCLGTGLLGKLPGLPPREDDFVRFRVLTGAALRLTALIAVAALLATACSKKTNAKASASASPSASPSAPPACPLTGAPAPAGSVPQRPAFAVKIPNDPTGRPQTGLDKTDIVYEEPVEGGITRLIAIYQCTDVDRIEPVRSGRFVDIDVLQQFGHPVFG